MQQPIWRWSAINFLGLSLVALFLLVGQAKAQTVSADRKDVVSGERVSITWSHPPVLGLTSPRWFLCIAKIPPHVARGNGAPKLGRSCVERDYRDTTDGQGNYLLSPSVWQPLEYQSYIVAVVDEDYDVHDHRVITVRHPTVPYRQDLIELPAGDRLYGGGERIPITLNLPDGPLSDVVSKPSDDPDSIGIYRLPVELEGGAILPGYYVGAIEVGEEPLILYLEQYDRNDHRARHGHYELHYIHHGFVLDREAFEIGLPPLTQTILDLEWEGRFFARIDGRQVRRVSSWNQSTLVQLLLYKVEADSMTQVAVEDIEISPATKWEEASGERWCQELQDPCFVDVAIGIPHAFGSYQLLLVHDGIVIGSERIAVTAEDIARMEQLLQGLTESIYPFVYASAGQATPGGSSVIVDAIVPRDPSREAWIRDVMDETWLLVIGKRSQTGAALTDEGTQTTVQLQPGRLLQHEVLLPAGDYVATIEYVGEYHDDTHETERRREASFDFSVEFAPPEDAIRLELVSGSSFTAHNYSSLDAKLLVLDDVAGQIDPARVVYVFENAGLTTAECYRDVYKADRKGSFRDDLKTRLGLPILPGTYAMRTYYPVQFGPRMYRLASEDLIEIKTPSARIRLAMPVTILVGERPRVLVERRPGLADEDVSKYAVAFFSTSGYIAPGGGLAYPWSGGGGRKHVTDESDFDGAFEGERARNAGSYLAQVWYGKILLDSVPFTVIDPEDPEQPNLAIASRELLPSYSSLATPYVPQPEPDFAIDCGYDAVTSSAASRDEPEEREEAAQDFPGYKPPPFLGLEAAVYPRHPVPGLPLTIAFRIENSSQYPAAGVTVDLTLADPGSEQAPRSLVSLTDFCERRGEGRFRCALGDMDPGTTGDLVFHAETPMIGALIWTAELGSAGDLGGMVERGGLLGARAPPRIVDVVVIAEQTRVEDEVPSYPYPFGLNSRGRQSRYLLIVGHNLPQRPADKLQLPDTDTINYSFLAYPDSNSPFYQSLFSQGWQLFYDTEDAAAAGERARQDGYDSILVRADLLEGILPGQHTLSASGAKGHWGLEFGDLSARLSFVRLLDDDSFDLLTHAYRPERIHLAVETNMPLPLEEIPVLLNPEELGAGQVAEIAMTARLSDIGDGRLYLSEPLDLHRPGRLPSLTGGRAIAVGLGGDSLGVLEARVDDSFLFKSLRIPLTPIIASVTIQSTPAAGDNSWMWQHALIRAAACHDDLAAPGDWDTVAHLESEEIWNLMILTTSDHFPGQSVKFGHHAASILLRDKFVALTEKQLRKLVWIKGNTQAVKGLLAYLKSPAAKDGNPLLRMKINDFSGGEIEFRYAANNDIAWLAEQEGTTEAAIEAWQLRETVNALELLIEAANEALEDARDAGDCDVEELVRLTGFSFGPIGQLLKSHLVTLAFSRSTGTRSHLWVPHEGARFWVDQVAPLAAAVKRQQAKARVDTDLTLFAVAVLTMPLMLTEGAVVSIVAFAVDLIDLGVTTVHELSQYADSEAELRFALGASITIGGERYEEALKSAKGWVSTSFGIGTAAFGAIAGGFDALPKLAALRRIARGRQIARSLEGGGGLFSLERVDLQDFGAFAMAAHMRRQASGASALSAAERSAIAAVEKLKALNNPARLLPEPDLPAANVVDAFAPSARLRFDPDVDSGLATVRPAAGRIEAPRTSGDVPNSREVRVPENGHLRVTTAAGVEELPLGRRLGGGYTSEVFAHADDPERLAIRVTYLRNDAPAAALDQFGDAALRTRVNSEHLRAVRVERSFDVVPSEAGQPQITRVLVVERLPETAQQTIARQGGRMTIAQMMAYEGAMRDLNRQGLVWLDNKWDNFAFVPLGDGSGRVQVVVMDPGGIALVRADAGLAAGQSVADVARAIQLRVNGDFVTQSPDFAFVGTPKFRTALRRDMVRDEFGDAFDYEAMGISGPDQLLFNPRSGEDFDYVAPLFEAAE